VPWAVVDKRTVLVRQSNYIYDGRSRHSSCQLRGVRAQITGPYSTQHGYGDTETMRCCKRFSRCCQSTCSPAMVTVTRRCLYAANFPRIKYYDMPLRRYLPDMRWLFTRSREKLLKLTSTHLSLSTLTLTSRQGDVKSEL
jgi:hypothetical protein